MTTEPFVPGPQLSKRDRILMFRKMNQDIRGIDQARAYADAGADWDLREYRPPVRKNQLLHISEKVSGRRSFLEERLRGDAGPLQKAAAEMLQVDLQNEGIGPKEAAAIVRAELHRIQQMIAKERGQQANAGEGASR